ncbi:hypothetical protein K2173_005184 [Erythroxylum novogranatense]|uniref:Uncharacterized protein n=1 Tax=Erythroxylum novogranatense TaxID=1862640 RepID=A0AAV8TRL5_9ROSI|nr:hypothetical protein K2173_005184 [Erythroxylum novogranatense]
MAASGPHNEFLKQASFGERIEHCSLDVVPLLLEEASLSVEENCSFHSSTDQNVYSVSMLASGGNSSPECASQVAVLSFVELPPKTKICIDPQLNCRNLVNLQMDNAEAYSPCIVDIDIDFQSNGKTKFDEETTGTGSIKSEGLLKGMLERQTSLKATHGFMQLFPDQSSTLDKSFTERIQGVPNNRLRRYKRTASFNSRKVAILFSLLSSLGTLILIYLTLRVKQKVEGFVNV